MYRPEDDPHYQPGGPPGPADAPPGALIAPDTRRAADRIPPGQARTRKWPVLHAADVPAVDPAAWTLTVSRPDGNPLVLDRAAFAALPRVTVFADFHCVTRWSRLGCVWEGVSAATVAGAAGWDAAGGGFVIAGAADVVGTAPGGGPVRWSTNLPLADFLSGHALLCDTADGVPLTADHGGPVRLVVPHLYAWKSAKWLTSLRLSPTNEPGYWERLGYADRGDPWLVDDGHPDGERFRDAEGRRPDEMGLMI